MKAITFIAPNFFTTMFEEILGEIRAFPFGTPPENWHSCNGALLSISQYAALYSLLGTTYGGDGKSTFALPNFNGSVLVGADESQNSAYPLGTKGGAASVALQAGEEAPHNHSMNVVQSANATTLAAATNMPGGSTLFCNALFVSKDPSQVLQSFNTDATPQTALNAKSITTSEGGAPHDNHQPYLAVNYCISLTGIYPAKQ